MGLLTLLFRDPLVFAGVAIVLLYSIIAHEIAHGWTAYYFGDDTARRYGRLTLNPLPHLDIVGTIMLFVLGFGWAKPVPVNYNALTPPRLGVIAVALSGCATNIGLAVLALSVARLPGISENQTLVAVCSIAARINIILGAFNLIPIPPLDGSKVLMGFLPLQAQLNLAMLEPYGFMFLILILVTGLLNPVIIFMQNMIYGFISLMFGA